VIRLAVRVDRAHAEEVLYELLAFSPAGLEEVDIDETAVEYVLYGAEGELPGLPALEASVGEAVVTVTTTEIADDWPERWREFHQPVTIAGRLNVRPPWHPPRTGLIDVVIEPAQAFGTGAHATTRLCLELLAELAPGGPLLDLGCGSGVLAIAAVKLGFAPVIAIDNDPAAVAATHENAAANGVELDVRLADLRDGPPPAPVIVANLLLGPLIELARRLDAQPAALIASGLLSEQGDELAGELASRGLRESSRRADGGWLAMLFEATDTRVSS
jgi:ribosomal protein L11 methyltransferase